MQSEEKKKKWWRRFCSLAGIFIGILETSTGKCTTNGSPWSSYMEEVLLHCGTTADSRGYSWLSEKEKISQGMKLHEPKQFMGA